jgi:hypothetical protein
MPVFAGGMIQNEKLRLDVVESQSKQIYSSRAQALIYNVILKYYDVVRQQGYARTLEASIRASRQRLDIVKEQQSVGVATMQICFRARLTSTHRSRP